MTGILSEALLPSVEACIPFKNKPTTTWINVHDAALFEKFGECFGLHRLAMAGFSIRA